MLSRRAYPHVRSLLSSSNVAIVHSRGFKAAVASQGPSRPPTLADITPNSATSFNEKQKNFREDLINAQKQKEQQESK